MGEGPGLRERGSAGDFGLSEIARLVVRFFVAAPLCLIPWWLMLPAYAWFTGHLAVLILHYVGGIPVERVVIERHGFLNTGTELAFVLHGTAHPFPAGVPVLSTVVPFVILVLATPGLALRRRLRVLMTGSAVLFAVQLAFLVTAFALRRQIAEARQISASITEVSFTLPFLLWLLLAYGDRLRALLGGRPVDAKSSRNADDQDTRSA